MMKINKKALGTAMAGVMTVASVAGAVQTVNIANAAESVALKEARANVDHLIASINKNYAGLKNQATWELYVKTIRGLIAKIPSAEKAQADVLTKRTNGIADTVVAIGNINHVEKSMKPVSEGGYGNHIGIKNAVTWREYLDVALGKMMSVDQGVFKEKYAELVSRYNAVDFAVEEIEYEHYEALAEVEDLYESAKETKNLETAQSALVEAKKLGTHPTSTEIIAKIETLIAEMDSNPSIYSVASINAVQIEVKFNKPVDPASIFVDSKSGSIKESVLKITSLETPKVNPGVITGSLSEDGKVLTITTKNTLLKRYDVVIDNVKTTDGKVVAKYDKTIIVEEDKKAPTITSTEQISPNKVKINFSEPVKANNSATLKYDNNTPVNGASIVIPAGATSVIVDLSASKVEVNKTITVTFAGLQDQVGNLISTADSTVKVMKKEADGISPVVSSITQTGVKTFSIKFSKDLAEKPKVEVSGDYIVNTVEKVSGSEYSVTVDKVLKGKLHVTVSDYKDLSSQEGKLEVKEVEFIEDTTAPTITSSKKVTLNGVEYLELAFDNEVTEGDIVVGGKYVKNHITYDVADKTVAAVYASDSNKKLLYVPLKEFAVEENAVYNINIISSTVKSLSGVAFTNTTTSFTRGKDSLTNTNKLSAPTITQLTNDTVTVTFNQEVDGASATNIANYTIAGAEIEDAVLAPYADSTKTQVLTLNLKKDSNNFTGKRNITVENVKALNSSVTMDRYILTTLSLNENVRPIVTNAKLNESKEIILTFSENIYDETNLADSDFELYIGGVKIPEGSLKTEAIAKKDAKNTLKITISDFEIKEEDKAKGLTLKAAKTLDIKDTINNALNFTSIDLN